MKEVLINIKGVQTVNGEKNSTELTTVGELKSINGKTYLRYDDSTSTGVDGVFSIIKIDEPDTVSIQHTGNLHSNLYVERQKRNVCHYETAYGGLELGVFGRNVETEIGNSCGKVKLNYTLDVNHGFLSENSIEITYKVTKEQ